MKKYLFISAAVLALASCTNYDPITAMYNGVEVETNSEITLQTPVMAKNSTKVGIDSTTFPKDTIFGTKVYYQKDKNWYDASVAQLYIDDDSIAYDSTIKTFRHLGKHYYWPKNGKLTFFSYFPVSVKNLVSVGADGKYVVTDFEVTDGKTDLMLATIKPNMTKNDTQAGVATVFNHKLTKVGVRARLKKDVDTNAIRITIKEVEFENALSKGTLEGDSGSVKFGTWTKETDRKNYWYADTSIVLERWIDQRGTDSTQNWYAEMGKDQLILMPQLMTEMYPTANGTDSVALRVKYDFTLKGNEVITETIDTCLNVVKMTNAKDWGINKYIVYRLEFGADEILFDPKVVEFDQEVYSDTTVIVR